MPKRVIDGFLCLHSNRDVVLGKLRDTILIVCWNSYNLNYKYYPTDSVPIPSHLTSITMYSACMMQQKAGVKMGCGYDHQNYTSKKVWTQKRAEEIVSLLSTHAFWFRCNLHRNEYVYYIVVVWSSCKPETCWLPLKTVELLRRCSSRSHSAMWNADYRKQSWIWRLCSQMLTEWSRRNHKFRITSWMFLAKQWANIC